MGLELQTEQYFDKLSLNQSLSFVNAKVLKGDTDININKNDKIPMVPKMKITLGAKYSLTDRLSLLANYTYISEKEVRELDDEDNIKKFTIDSYGTLI